MSSPDAREELLAAVERRRAMRTSAESVDLQEQEQGEQAERVKQVASRQAVELIRVYAQAAVDTLVSLGIPQNHQYRRHTGFASRFVFTKPKPTYQHESVWAFEHRITTSRDSNPGSYAGSFEWSLEKFTGLDADAQIHRGYRGNDQQGYAILDDESLLYGTGTELISHLIRDSGSGTNRLVTPPPLEQVVVDWQTCFADGIVELSEPS